MPPLFTVLAASAPSSPRRSEEPVSRSEMLELIEIELTKARKMAERPGDEVLCYLIDMAILEARSKNRSEGGGRDDRIELFTRIDRSKA